MLNFLRSAKKQKKIAIGAVLFFVLMGTLSFVVMPISVSASAATIGAQAGAATAGAGATEQEYLDTSWLDPAPAGTTPSVGVLRWIGNLISGVWSTVKTIASLFTMGGWSWLFGELISLVSQLFKYIAEGSATLFRYVLSEIIVDAERVGGAGQVERAGNQWAITRGGGNTAVLLIAWNMVKNWANMIIVLLLIASAAMMILRLWADKAKKLLTDVIILALLINFSIVFVGLIIDASNVITKTLIVGAEQEVLIIKQIDKAWNAVARPLNKPIDFRGVANYLAIAGLLDLMYLIAAFVLLAFSLIVIQRYIVLAILFVLSPLAFAFRIFPHESATGLWNSWWQNFLKYCFMLVPAAFFLRLSSEILVALDWGELRKPENLTVLVFNFIIVMGFLVAGLIITKRSMGPMVGAVMGMATKIATGTVGLAAGAAASLGLGAAKLTARQTGVAGTAQRAWEETRYYGTKLGEKMGMVKKGTADLKRQQSIKKEVDASESEKRYSAMSSDDRLKAAEKVKHRRLNTPHERAEAVGLAKSLLAKGEFGKLGAEQQKEMMRLVRDEAPGEIPMSDFTKANPDLAKYDKEAINQEKKKLVGKTAVGSASNPLNTTGRDIEYTENDINNPNGVLYEQMQEEAENKVRRTAFDRMDTKDIKDKNDTDLIKLSEEETAEGAKALGEAIKRGIIHRVKGGNRVEISRLLNRAKTNYGSNIKPAYKIDPRLIEHDTEAVKKKADEIITATPTLSRADAEDRAKKQLVHEGYKGLNSKEVKEMSEEAFTEEFVHGASSDKVISKAGELGLSAEKRKKLKSLRRVLRATRNAMPIGKKRDDLTRKIKAISAL